MEKGSNSVGHEVEEILWFRLSCAIRRLMLLKATRLNIDEVESRMLEKNENR